MIAVATQRRPRGSPAGVHLRGPLAASCRPPSAAPVPLPAPAGWLQQAPAPGGGAAAPRHPGGRHRHQLVDRRRLDHRLHPGGVRSLPGDHQALGAGRMAQYGYCASHSRYFWGLRLHLLCTLHGLPVGFALTGAKADERQVLVDLLAAEPELVATRPGQTLLADKHYYGRQFEQVLAELGVRLLRPARKGEPQRPGAHLFRPLRQLIESVNDTFKGQLDLERHGGRTPGGVAVRVLQRILALAAAIWHNHKTGQPTLRSLVAYDH